MFWGLISRVVCVCVCVCVWLLLIQYRREECIFDLMVIARTHILDSHVSYNNLVHVIHKLKYDFKNHLCI